MRIHELTEAISVTHLAKPLTDAIYEQILYCANQIGYQDKKVPLEIKQYAIENTSLSKVIETIDTNKVLRNLTVLVAYGMQEVLRKSTEVKDITVTFKETDPKIQGYADGTGLVISDKRIKICMEEIFETVFNLTIDNLSNDKNIFDDYFKTFRELSLRELLRYSNIDKLVTDIVSVAVHELVHIIQHDTQYKKGRTSTEYRSYLEKDKNKFHNTVRKFYTKDAISDKERETYLGSPQEIASFAHENALKCINDLGVYTAYSLDELEEIKQRATSYISSYMDDQFAGNKSGTKLQIFKRANKLLYQEVMRAIEYTENKLKKNNGV